MTYMETLTRDERYCLMGAIRGPDAHQGRGFTALKREITSRIRVIVFDLFEVSGYGVTPKGSSTARLPGDEKRTALTSTGLDAIRASLKEMDTAGALHYLNHLLDPFNRIDGFEKLPIWGGFGIEVKQALSSRINAGWKMAPKQRDIDAYKAQRDEVIVARDDLSHQLMKLRKEADGSDMDRRKAARLLNVIRDITSDGCRNKARLDGG